MGHVIDVLRGSRNERIRELGHDRLSTYGIGSALGQDEWGSIIRQLVHLGYVEQDMARYSVLRLTEAARPVLRGEQTLTLARARVRPVSAKKAKKGAEMVRGGQVKNDGLFQALRALRKEIANREGVPPFVVFGDATLTEMAARQPRDAGELLQISGVGQHKLGKYGVEFLRVISGFNETPERDSP
jgi:ATP-dependent DNA helicase RecQ